MKEYFSLGLNCSDKVVYFQKIIRGNLTDTKWDLDNISCNNDFYYFSDDTDESEPDFSEWFYKNKTSDSYEKEDLVAAATKTKKNKKYIGLIFHINDSVHYIKSQIEEILILKEII